VFNKSQKLCKGKQNLLLWEGVEGDHTNRTTPGKPVHRNHNISQLNKLDKITKKYNRGEIAHIDWLDTLSFQKIEEMKQMNIAEWDDELLLCIELPTFEYPVKFHEKTVNPEYPQKSNNSMVVDLDPELTLNQESNPIDTKHLRLMIGQKVNDPNLRPSPAERDRILKIIHFPITRKLEVEDRNTLWKFRFYLTSQKEALTKFLRCVDWTNMQEVRLATDLLTQWKPIDVSDALELLSKHFTYHVVRDYAVSRLQHATNEELLHYLLQLVQALRYDSNESHESKLCEFLIDRSMEDSNLRNFLYWYLKVECEDPKYGDFYMKKFEEFKHRLRDADNDQGIGLTSLQDVEESLEELKQVDKELRLIRNRKDKLQKFREVMQQNGGHKDLYDFKKKQLPLPLRPDVSTFGIEPITIFTSSAEPLMIRYKTGDDGFDVIYKNGDDLRQDQIIVQLISLMDNLLRKESLDLKLTPYKVLATSTKEGRSTLCFRLLRTDRL